MTITCKAAAPTFTVELWRLVKLRNLMLTHVDTLPVWHVYRTLASCRGREFCWRACISCRWRGQAPCERLDSMAPSTATHRGHTPYMAPSESLTLTISEGRWIEDPCWDFSSVHDASHHVTVVADLQQRCLGFLLGLLQGCARIHFGSV